MERSPSGSAREPPDELALSEVVASRSGSGLERLVREHAAGFTRRYAGLSVGAVVRDEQTTLGFGRANEDGRAPDGRTIFQIGSVTKVFTALLLADAVHRGEVALDQPVGSLIPGVAVHPQGRPIKLLDLATHSAGLPRLPPGLARQSLRHRADPYAGFTTQQLVDALARTPKRPPGTKVRYSNFGAGVLGEALCRATGTTFEEMVQSRISQPLGLDDTMVHATSEQGDRLATGHSRRGKPVADWQLPAMPAAGALRSTAADLVTFIRSHLHPDRSPLAEPLHLLMQTPGAGWTTPSCGAGVARVGAQAQVGLVVAQRRDRRLLQLRRYRPLCRRRRGSARQQRPTRRPPRVEPARTTRS